MLSEFFVCWPEGQPKASKMTVVAYSSEMAAAVFLEGIIDSNPEFLDEGESINIMVRATESDDPPQRFATYWTKTRHYHATLVEGDA